MSKEEAETLALLLANKQAKSPTGVAISRRGGKQVTKGGKGRKGGIKKEQIKEEEEAKVKIKEEEVEEDSDLPKANKIVSSKQKYHPNSKYPQDEYKVN
jgi:hypothetical protein